MAWIDEILRFVAHARKPDGSLDECRLDGDGNLRVTLATDAPEPAWDDSPGFVASRVVKAGASTLFHLDGLCDSEGYLLVFDANGVPVNGTKPTLAPIRGGVGVPLLVALPPRGRSFKYGIAWAMSSTADVLTLDTKGRAFINAQRT